MRFGATVIAKAATFLLMLCWPLLGKGDEDYEALTILTRHCAGCHQQEGHPGALFLRKEKLSEPETIRIVKKVVETSKMPPAHAQFKNTPDGKQLLDWLHQKASSVK